MKTTLKISVLLLSAAIACACAKEKSKPDGTMQTNPTALILDASETQATFVLTTNREWNIEPNDAWITDVQPSSGTSAADHLVITITTTANDGVLRTGSLTVTVGETPFTISVSQASIPPAATLGQVYLMKATIEADPMGFNLLSDPGFEDYPTQPISYRSPWWILAANRSTDAHSGQFSAIQNFNNPENLGFQTFCGQPNTNYTLTAWFKNTTTGGMPTVFFGIREGLQPRAPYAEVNITGDLQSSWAQHTVNFNSGSLSVLEAFCFVFNHLDALVQFDDIVVKRTGDNQTSYKLTNLQKVGSIFSGLNGEITSSDGCTAWDGGNGQTMFAFGENVGEGDATTRANALAISTNNGATASAVKQGSLPKVLIAPNGGAETGIIPTAGVNVGTRQYIHYMSVASKGFAEDMWSVNGSGIAYSDDNGVNWIQANVGWSSGSNFIQVALLKDGGYVYMYGTTAGRVVDGEQYIHLARAAEANVATQSAWEYWNGASWVSSATAATPIVYGGTIGELSVVKNATTGRYMMIYSSVKRGAIVIRDAATPTGDWSGEKIVMTDTNLDILYAPSFVSASGNDIYFLVNSAWGE